MRRMWQVPVPDDAGGWMLADVMAETHAEAERIAADEYVTRIERAADAAEAETLTRYGTLSSWGPMLADAMRRADAVGRLDAAIRYGR